MIFNLSAYPLVQPDRYFFQANGGPYLGNIVWSDWGTDQATGSGTYNGCAEDGGPFCDPIEAPARFTLIKPVACPRLGPGSTTYTDGTIEIDKPTGTKRVDFDEIVDFCALRPTKQQAAAAIKARLRRRGSISHVTLTCSPARGTGSDIALDCTVRFNQGGRRRTRSFEVSGRIDGPPRLD
ncbi:MAG: hypothetical protein ACJ762_19820 [Solirubrobacteraceae bacterium]